MKKIKGQNTVTEITKKVGYDKKHHPIVKKFKIETTNKRLIIYDSDGNIVGEAGVLKSEDFNYDVLLSIAFEKSGSKLDVA